MCLHKSQPKPINPTKCQSRPACRDYESPTRLPKFWLPSGFPEKMLGTSVKPLVTTVDWHRRGSSRPNNAHPVLHTPARSLMHLWQTSKHDHRANTYFWFLYSEYCSIHLSNPALWKYKNRLAQRQFGRSNLLDTQSLQKSYLPSRLKLQQSIPTPLIPLLNGEL